jgi:hypothetical protein
MAFGAPSSGRIKDTAGVRQRRLFTYTGVAYTTTGEAITPQQLGLGVIEHIPVFAMTNATPLVVLCVFNHTTSKIMCFWVGAAGGMVEVTNATDLTGYSGRVEVFGR